MMAPYAIAHMKIGLKLFETGYQFGSGERARIYLNNALEQRQDFSDTFEQMAPALAHEAQAVNDVKRQQRFTVIIGNPPYSKLSSNWNEWIDGLLHGKGPDAASSSDYYQVDGAKLGERTVWIQDDYIKFTRLSQWHIDRSGIGIHGYISNNGYLDNPTLRGMRQQLNTSFPQMYVLDLHGSMKRGEVGPDGTGDGNVFDIQQGVAIGLFVKGVMNATKCVRHSELWGDRANKYGTLIAQKSSSTKWTKIEPSSPFHLFVPVDASNQAEYDAGWKVTDIFGIYHTGIITKRDALTIHWTAADVLATVSDFISLSPAAARKQYTLPADVRDWTVEWAQKDLRQTGIHKNRAIPVLYRPFDIRFTYFTGNTRGFVGWPVADMTRLMLAGDNLALLTTRMTKGEDFGHVMVSRQMAEVICLSSKTSNNAFVFPLYATETAGDFNTLIRRKSAERELNIRPAFMSLIPATEVVIEPESVLGYIVAILSSPTYRTRY
jgi:predicted helicase